MVYSYQEHEALRGTVHVLSNSTLPVHFGRTQAATGSMYSHINKVLLATGSTDPLLGETGIYLLAFRIGTRPHLALFGCGGSKANPLVPH